MGGQKFAVDKPQLFKEVLLGVSSPSGEILLMDENSSFATPEAGCGKRLFCVLVPESRKLEFQSSELAACLIHCTDKIIFYTEIV